jgi:hypothetical protein
VVESLLSVCHFDSFIRGRVYDFLLIDPRLVARWGRDVFLITVGHCVSPSTADFPMSVWPAMNRPQDLKWFDRGHECLSATFASNTVIWSTDVQTGVCYKHPCDSNSRTSHCCPLEAHECMNPQHHKSCASLPHGARVSAYHGNQHGGSKTEGLFKLFCSMEKTCLDGGQHGFLSKVCGIHAVELRRGIPNHPLPGYRHCFRQTYALGMLFWQPAGMYVK